MAVYTPQQLGIKPPPGGFKQGGWYQGRQYWNGTLSDPGVIHPESNQRGAGQAVSKEVVQQTSQQNWDYLQRLKSQQQSPQSPNDVNSYLNDFQKSIYETKTGPVDRFEKLKQLLEPKQERPEPINRVQIYQNLRQQYGLDQLESQLNELKAQEQDLYANLRQRATAERNKPVPQNVIEGRIGQEERQYRERLDYVSRLKSRLVDELNVRYTTIDNLIKLHGLDYQDAVKSYEDEFQKNLAIYKTVRSDMNDEQKIAASNLQTIMNLAVNGNISYQNLPTDQKLMIRKLELQAGLPAGIMERVKTNPKDQIVFTNRYQGYTQIGVQQPDGSIQVKTFATPNAGSSGSTSSKKQIENMFLEDANKLQPRDVNNVNFGIFPQLVMKYAPLMSLSDIYKYYMSSEAGKKYGKPKENPKQIMDLYNVYRGKNL